MYSVVLNRANGATLGKNLFIKGLLSLQSGDLNFNSYVINMDTAATLSEQGGQTLTGTNGYITTTRLLSSALTNMNVGGMGLKLTTTSAPGYTAIKRGHVIYTNGGGMSIRRYFDVTTTNSVTASYFELIYDSTELNGAARGKLRLNKSTNGGSTWSVISGCLPTTASSATGYVSKAGGIALSSTTQKFTASDSVSSSLSPVFVVPTPSVTAAANIENKVSVYPNPFNENLTVEMNMPAGIYALTIMDMNGKVIDRQNIETIDGVNRIVLSASTYAKGIYIMNISGANTTHTLRIVKQ